MSDSYRRMRNTARFLLGNLNGFDPQAHMVSVADLVDLDRWAIGRAAELQARILKSYDDYAFHRVYQDLHNFCVVDMGGFYLDIIKDRLYTTGADSLPRRSAQTAMFHIAEAMVRWLAPILSFTAEEIWQELPADNRSDSVFLAEFYELPDVAACRANWPELMQVTETVAKALEALRNSGDIGSGLEANVIVFADGKMADALNSLGDELRFVFITSTASVQSLASAPKDATAGEGFAVSVAASSEPKCTRCWHRRQDVGAVAGHPEICGRCAANVTSEGETRVFA